jgi:hypothetical protein
MSPDIPFGGHDSVKLRFYKKKVLFFNYDYFSIMVISFWSDDISSCSFPDLLYVSWWGAWIM